MPDDARVLVRQSFLQHLYGIDTERQRRYALYRDYYDGEQATKLTKRLRRVLQVKGDEEFRGNYCGIPVDALAERLKVTGFNADDTLVETLSEWWKTNRMDGVQGDVHLSSIRDGDAFVIVEWNDEDEIPRFSMELAYDGSDGVKIHYSDERRGVVAFASKRWVITNPTSDAGKVRRINLYYPDRIEKYISNADEVGGDWEQYQDDDDPQWPIPWLRGDGSPRGVPIIHFAYRASGYNFGKSRISDIIPKQNELNKAMIDVVGVADTSAFPILWGTGDDFGNVEVGPGTFIQSDNADAKIGRIAPGDITGLLAYKNDIVVDIARISNTPLSRFQLTGHVASEGTLKQQESGLVSDAESTQVYFGNSWEDVMKMGIKLTNDFGKGKLDEEQSIDTEWKPAAVRDETELITRLGVMSEKLNVPDSVLWRRAGLTEEEIEKAEKDPQYLEHRAMQGVGMLMNEENRE